MLTKTHDFPLSAYINKKRYAEHIILTKNHGKKML